MDEMKEEAIQRSLKTAFAHKDVKKILSLVKNEKLDINHRDISHDLETFLMKICFVDIPEASMLQILEALWEREQEPDVNLQDSLGRTALMHACISGRNDIADFLLSKDKTRIEVFDFDGNSAIIPAIKSGNYAIVKRLLDIAGGVSLLSIYNSNGESPLSLATKLGKKDIIQLIESYQNKLIPMPEDSKKKKKHKKKEYSLPPTYSPRTAQQFSLKEELQKYAQESPLSYQHSPVGGSTKCSNQINSDNKDLHSLWLTSAKLERNNHKPVKKEYGSKHSSPEIILPSILSANSPPKATEMKKKSSKKERRGSISLPDLREFPGGLVASGENSPANRYNDNDTTDDELTDEEVFIPVQYLSPRKKPFGKKSLRKSVSEKTIILPDIHSPQNGVRTPNTKRSNSEEQLNKISVLSRLL